MGYLEIKKKKKLNFKAEKENIDDLIKKYDFSPTLNIDEYLAFAFNNYKTIIQEAINYYQTEIIANNLKIDNSYLLKLAEWLDEVAKKDKDEYYRRLFIFEYLEKFK